MRAARKSKTGHDVGDRRGAAPDVVGARHLEVVDVRACGSQPVDQLPALLDGDDLVVGSVRDEDGGTSRRAYVVADSSA